MNARWTGIKLDQFRSCSKRGLRRGSGGTILIAFGSKAEVVLACLRAGCLSEIVMDCQLAADLAAQLGYERD